MNVSGALAEGAIPVSTSSHSYSVFGLNVSSDFPLTGLKCSQARADVRVRRTTEIPGPFAGGTFSGGGFDVVRDNYLLHVPAVGSYWVRNGQEILVSPAPDAPWPDVQTFLFGAAFTALLHQRGTLVLHAAAIAGAKGAVLVAGPSGVGKSTTAAALELRGQTVLSDDVAVVSRDPLGHLLVHPGPPHISLWAETARRLGRPCFEVGSVRRGVEKYSVPASLNEGRHAQPVIGVLVLCLGDDDWVETEEVAGRGAFEALRTHTRCWELVGSLGKQLAHFRLAAEIAARVPVVMVRRPAGRDSIREVADVVQEALAQGPTTTDV